MTQKFFLFFILNLIACIQFSFVSAENRALLIGVGEYKNNVKELPGVIFDIESMRDSAQILGFKPENIKVLLNQQATIKNVRKTIENWLIKETQVEDKVLIYFTGHGSRIPDTNGDEVDGADEVLILYDTKVVSKNNKHTLINVLIDDELNQYLQQIKSHDIMLLVDACNSGTVYRGVSFNKENEVTGKFLNYSGIPKVQQLDVDKILSKIQSVDKSYAKAFDNNTDNLSLIDKSNNKAVDSIIKVTSIIKDPDNFRFVAFTAAGDNELALATKKGSIFTQGINYYLKLAAINKQQITPQQLIDKVSLYIETKVQEGQLGAVYQPHLAGNQQMFNKALSFVDPPQARVNWNRIINLDSSVQKLLISSSKNKLILGESLTIDIKIPHQGYLNVISVGPDDEVFILYPNYWDKNNLVKAGVTHLPTDKMDFKIKLSEPVGKNIMLAVLTSKPINLYEQSVEGRDKQGQMFSSLQKLSKLTKNTASSYLSGKVIIDVSYK